MEIPPFDSPGPKWSATRFHGNPPRSPVHIVLHVYNLEHQSGARRFTNNASESVADRLGY